MGDQGRSGGAAAGLRAGYDAAADGWADGPGRMYAPLARALVAAAPVPLAGRLVLDLGAGTGAAGRAALAAGARRVVAVDLAEAMLRLSAEGGHGPAAGLHPVAGDAAALPFRDRGFDLVLAAFCLNHLDSPATALAEARRVAAAIAASTFAPGWTHPVKDAVDEALAAAGYTAPAWHASLAPGSRASDPDALAERAAAAGFTRIRTRTIAVPTGLRTPADLVAWRLGMAHVVPFLRSLDTGQQAAVRRSAERAVTAAGPLVVAMTVLTGS